MNANQQSNPIKKQVLANLFKGDKVSIKNKTGVFEVVGITGQGRVRFLNRENGQRELILVAFVEDWIVRL